MRYKNCFKVLNSQDVYREFFGEPGKVNISPRSQEFVNTAMKSLDPWTNDNQYKDAVHYALGKQAEMGERFGIPTDRMIRGLTLVPRDVSENPDAMAYYTPESDTIHLPEPADAYSYINGQNNPHDVDMNDLRAFLHALLAHEHDHYLLFHSIGRPFESELQKAHQMNKVTVPSNSGWGWSSFYRKPYRCGLSTYGAEDLGLGYPSEELPELSRIIASGKYPLSKHLVHKIWRAVLLKRRMLQSLHKQGMADIPNPTIDLYDDIYGKGPVTTADETKISNTVEQAMKNLAAAKEKLRNVLAFKQNQNLGLPWLAGWAAHSPNGNEAHDFGQVMGLNRLLGITAPAVDGSWNPDAFRKGKSHPVSRHIDPLMHSLAKKELINPNNGYKMNRNWLTPIGSWDHFSQR